MSRIESTALLETKRTPTEEAYGRFVPHQFLQLLERPNIVDVTIGDHVEQEMTLLFSDIRDFTALSESILPAENFRFINSYLSTMEPVVGRHQGFIDKYIGDAIMALFPADADDAVCCGIDMLRELVTYNQGRARAGYVPIRIGIGVNTGLVMLGTVGGHSRMDSTVIGDAVNQASRLENLTKLYRTPFLVSEHTLHALKNPGAYHIRFIDRQKIKGRYPAQSMYEVFDADPEPLRLAKLETLPLFNEAIACYLIGNAVDAIPLLEQCVQIAPDDLPASVYLERCRGEQRKGNLSFTLRKIELEWCDYFSVGSEGIDQHHREILAEIGELANAAESGRDVASILFALAGHFRQHFDAEENLMRRYGYPFINQHQRQHQVFCSAFAALGANISAKKSSIIRQRLDIQLHAADRYINHISKSDAHLGHFLQRAGVS